MVETVSNKEPNNLEKRTDVFFGKDYKTLIGIGILFTGIGSCLYLSGKENTENNFARAKAIEVLVQQYGSKMSPYEFGEYLRSLNIIR